MKANIEGKSKIVKEWCLKNNTSFDESIVIGSSLLQRGTPKTLCSAIENGAFRSNTNDLLSNFTNIKTNVKDFLAQKFNIAMLENEDNNEVVEVLNSLFEKITKE